jgi:hypothetical protein
LDRLKEEFEITVAAGNFSFTCKKFYFLRLAEELGFDSDVPGNDTYTCIAVSEAGPCKGALEG